MTDSTRPAQGRIYFMLILTTLFWGGSFLFTKIGLRDVPPPVFVLVRFTLATLIMLAVFARRLTALNRDILRRGVIVGSALGLTNISFVFGVQGTSISRAGVLNNLFVLFIPLITKLVWKDRVGRTNLGGIILAAAGIWLLATSGGIGFNRGDLISTVCAFFIAGHIITVSKVLRDDDVYAFAVHDLFGLRQLRACQSYHQQRQRQQAQQRQAGAQPRAPGARLLHGLHRGEAQARQLMPRLPSIQQVG